MKKERIMALALAGVMCLSAAAPAFAAYTPSAAASQHGTIVKFDVDSGYTWTIPAEIEPTAQGNIAALEVTKNNIAYNEQIRFTVTGDDYTADSNKWLMKQTTSDSTIEYTISVDSVNKASGDTVYTIASAALGTKDIAFTSTELDRDDLRAGHYQDSITFEAAVEEAP